MQKKMFILMLMAGLVIACLSGKYQKKEAIDTSAAKSKAVTYLDGSGYRGLPESKGTYIYLESEKSSQETVYRLKAQQFFGDTSGRQYLNEKNTVLSDDLHFFKGDLYAFGTLSVNKDVKVLMAAIERRDIKTERIFILNSKKPADWYRLYGRDEGSFDIEKKILSFLGLDDSKESLYKDLEISFVSFDADKEILELSYCVKKHEGIASIQFNTDGSRKVAFR